jgi:murein DD-endopeptidase MepM/ murein hydrolase activator NlpD
MRKEMVNIFIRGVFLYLFLTLSLYGANIETSTSVVSNAQTFVVTVDSEDVEFEALYVTYQNHRYPFVDNFYALVPTSYYATPKKTKAVVVYKESGKKKYKSIPITIIQGKYKVEKLSVDPSRANISIKDRKRIKRESKEAKKLYSHFSSDRYWSEPFIRPLNSKITSRFGNRRLFNGMLKSYHSGTDFRASTGTPIVSINDGMVVYVGDRFFAGNTVVVDHGEGIFTSYSHLSKFSVNKGDIVFKGDIVGLAGATGRVTGPHLHFGVNIHGVKVDPMNFLEVISLIAY